MDDDVVGNESLEGLPHSICISDGKGQQTQEGSSDRRMGVPIVGIGVGGS